MSGIVSSIIEFSNTKWDFSDTYRKLCFVPGHTISIYGVEHLSQLTGPVDKRRGKNYKLES
jgi:hypothetical protein